MRERERGEGGRERERERERDEKEGERIDQDCTRKGYNNIYIMPLGGSRLYVVIVRKTTYTMYIVHEL